MTQRRFKFDTLLFAAGVTWLVSLSNPAIALEIPEVFVPVRPLGMGDAFVAVANDEDAVWHNPAGVSRIRKARSRSTLNLFKLPNVSVGVNTEGRAFYQEFNQQDDSLADYVAENSGVEAGKPFWFNVSAFPMMMLDLGSVPSLIGLFSNNTGKIVIEQDSSETAEVEIISDVGGVVSMAFPDRTNRFAVGVTVRGIARYAYQDLVPTNDLDDREVMRANFEGYANQSIGIGVDIGMIATFADFWYPTIGLSILNLPIGCKDDYLNPFSKKRQTICGTVYSGSFANEDALSTVDPTDIRAGFSVTPRLGRNLAIRLAADIHHLNFEMGDETYAGLPDIEFNKMVHMGAELFVGNPLLPSDFAIRTGYSQGFFAMGASFTLGFIAFDFATYGRDVSSTTKAIEDRRVVGTLSLDF